MKYILPCLPLIFLTSCLTGLIQEGTTFLAEDFEGYSNTEDLFQGPSSKWGFFQQTESDNYIEFDTTRPHSGEQCLKIFAKKGREGFASKSDLANTDMGFREGDIIHVSMWFYIEGTKDLTDIFLFDIEENVQIGAGPGLRLALESPVGFLKIERRKMLESDIEPVEENQIPFPRNQWVHLEIEIQLSRNKDGYIQVFQNDTLLIDAQQERTLPRDRIVFIQGAKGIYDNVQVGITANSLQHDATIYVDDIEILQIN
ncbi:MAG: heparin lyase I family protein [Bacteroidota bacterium]